MFSTHLPTNNATAHYPPSATLVVPKNNTPHMGGR